MIQLRFEHVRNPTTQFWTVDKSYGEFRELHTHLRMRYQSVAGIR